MGFRRTVSGGNGPAKSCPSGNSRRTSSGCWKNRLAPSGSAAKSPTCGRKASGHVYFTLKDAAAQLSCVLFRGTAAAQRNLLADGQKVLLQGDVTVYEARGQYQLIVREVELQGVGALQIAFEKLKQKLAAEGLFAPERKRPLPALSAAHRPGHFADGRGHPRRAARRAAAESGAGNHPRALPRARRRRGEGNCGSDPDAE